MPELNPVDYTITDAYKFYKEDILDGLQVSYKDYRAVLKTFNKLLVKDVLYNSSEITFPSNIGAFRIRKRKVNLENINKLLPDWQATNKLKKKQLVYHLNEHRKGYKYKVYWDKRKSRVKNHTVYYFKPCRDWSRELAYVLKNLFEIDYYL
jgi:hypothetical protein